MRNEIKAFFCKSLIALTLLLGLAPVFLLLGIGILPDLRHLWYGFPCAAYLLGAISYLIKGRWRMVWTALSALMLIALGFVFLLPTKNVYAFFLPLAALGYFLVLVPAYRRPLGGEWSFGVWAACLGAHLIANIVAVNAPALAKAQAPLNVAFALYALSGLLLMNYVSLSGGMGDASRPPRAIRRRNMLATALIYIVALCAALWDVLFQALQTAVGFIKRVISDLIDFLMRLYPQSETPGVSGGGGMDIAGMLGEEVPEPSAFSILMEKILIGVFTVLAAAGLLIGLYFLFKKLRKALRALLARLRKYMSAVGETYTDQAESIFSLEQWAESARERIGKAFRRRERPTPWKQLDGRARVRRLYGEYIKRRPAAPSDTAREALIRDEHLEAAEDFAALYDRARYSTHDVAPDEADALRDRLTTGENRR